MPIEGRSDRGHVAMLDHPGKAAHPIPWHVDVQLGLGPAWRRLGDGGIKKGEAARAPDAAAC